jgi:hypothetical protein
MKAKVQASPAVDVSMDKVRAILERARELGLPEEECALLGRIAETCASLIGKIADQDATIRQLREMVFGSKTEKTRNVVGGDGASPGPVGSPPPDAGPKKKPKGHGRIGAGAYTGAERVKVRHPSLQHGDRCPECNRGKLYQMKEPSPIVRVWATVPFQAKVYEKDRLRCNGCGQIFTAPSPEGVGEEKFDETVPSMVGLLRYGSGMPFYRIQELQKNLGLPLPASVQWELVSDAAEKIAPAYNEIVRQAAQGELLCNDDTPMKIFDFLVEARKRKERGEKPPERTGTFTSGIVSEKDRRKIVLYYTGRNHAGENLAGLLRQRDPGLDPPIQMCDGLDRNLPGELETIVANCAAHGRRQFVKVAESFPTEVRHVLEELALVYRNDDRARSEGMSPENRLLFHQQESRPVMDRLKLWMESLLAEKKVEPNSGLGQAITYVSNRWARMTLFLRKPGAPLDNNVTERMLKRAILHRKNSLFYKTENGARVGDLYMTLIGTARINEADAFDYLTELQRHTKEVAANPADWMPWNYRETLARAKPPP